MTDNLRLLRALYQGPSLPDISDKLAAQFAALRLDPNPESCSQLIRALHEAATSVGLLRAGLQRGRE